MPAPSLRASFPLLLTFFAALAVLILATGVSTSSAQTTINICDRTPEVEAAILARIHDPQGGGSPGTTCESVTPSQLRLWRFSPLKIEGYSSASIVPSDFEGIRVGDLWITNSPQLTTIPANAFSGLSEFSDKANVNANKLVLKNNAIDTVERGAFSGVKFEAGNYGDIDLSGNRIAVLPAGVFEGTTHLEYVDLAHNYIEFLDGDTFTGLSNLKGLDLGTNNIQRLDPSIFAPLPNLDSVELRNNSLSSLPAGLFDGLTSLRLLHLIGNKLTGLPADIFNGLTSLQTLSLNGNSLSSLPADIFNGLTSLKNLYLLGNALEELDADLFDGLTSLTLLDLTGNRLTSLAADIFADPPLIALALGLNRLSTLPATVFAPLKSSLQRLRLNGNALTTLDADVFDGLTGLLLLELHDNALEELDADLFDGLTALQQLWLRSNALEDLDADVFDGLAALLLLTLDDNNFGTLPADVFDGLGNLRYLTLARAGLTSLGADLFDGLDNSLLYLYLNDNDFGTLPADVFDGLTGLQRLYLHGNALTTLPADVFDGLTALQQLDLNGNGLTELPANRFDDLASLQQLFLTNNSIPSLPANVFTGLSSLEQLDFSCNALTALDLTRFDPFAASLTFLDIRSNDFTTAPTETALRAKLTVIQNLYLGEANTDDDDNCLLPYDAGLSALSLSIGTLNPEFEAPGLTRYTTTVGGDVSSMTITPTPLDPDAVIGRYDTGIDHLGPEHVSNLYWDDEDATPDDIEVDLPGPRNRVRWAVTPRNGSAEDARDYRLDVLRPYPPGSIAVLDDLTLSGLELRPAFDSSTLTYWVSVPSTPTTTTVTATGLDSAATVVIKRDGVEVSGALALAADTETTLTIEVTAEDGTTTRTYTVRVTPSGLAREVPADWALVPPGLAPGERFRLLFVTSTRRNAIATDISDYDAFIQAAVRASGRAALAEHADHFRVLGSTASVDALGHVGLTGAGELIWWLGAGSMEAYDVSGRVSGKVAGTAADFFDGRWAHPAAIRTERGDRIPDADLAAVKVFTGTDTDGTAVVGRQLGNQTGVVVDAFDSQSTRTTPLNDGHLRSRDEHRFYGLSGPFIVGPASALPTSALADDGTLRLADETAAGEGRLEYHQDGIWGTVCNDRGFRPDYNTAYGYADTDGEALRNVTSEVACRLLGYADGTSIEGYGQAGVSLAEQAITLDDVLCQSDTAADVIENMPPDDNWPDHAVDDPVLLTHCNHAGPGWTFHNCTHRDDVGLACTGDRAGDDHTSPQVRRVWIEPPPDGVAFRRDETITVQVAFSEAVTVTGTPCLPLALRRANNTAHEVEACYAGSGSGAVQPFTYTVEEGDHGPVEVPRNSLMLGATDTIRDAAGRDAIGVYDRARCTGTDTTTDTTTNPPTITTVCSEVTGTNTMDTKQLVHHGVPPMASRWVNSERTPSAVRNLRGQADTREVQLDWQAPADPGDEPVSGYEYAVDDGAWQQTSGGAAKRGPRAAQTGTQHTLTDLTPGQPYTVRVRAVNEYGGGPAAETTVELASSPLPSNPPPPPEDPADEEGDPGDSDDSGDTDIPDETDETDDSGDTAIRISPTRRTRPMTPAIRISPTRRTRPMTPAIRVIRGTPAPRARRAAPVVATTGAGKPRRRRLPALWRTPAPIPFRVGLG